MLYLFYIPLDIQSKKLPELCQSPLRWLSASARWDSEATGRDHPPPSAQSASRGTQEDICAVFNGPVLNILIRHIVIIPTLDVPLQLMNCKVCIESGYFRLITLK